MYFLIIFFSILNMEHSDYKFLKQIFNLSH